MADNCKLISLIAVTFVLIGVGAWGYEIGVGDLLEVEIWQQPELSTTVSVYSDGTVILPIIGSVKVDKMTPTRAADLISKKLSTFNPRISQVTVRVIEFNSKSLFVLGEVATAGRYGFENIPDLVAVLTEAGGPTEEAALSDIIVLRANPSRQDSSKNGRALTVDLEKIINGGNLNLLPSLKPGDLIWVPRVSSRLGANRVSIFGEVNTAGVYTIGSDTDLLDLILLAGGPTEEADLGRVKLIRTMKGSVMINLGSYLRKGEKNMIPRLNPDDIVVVSRKSRFWSNLWNGFRETVMVLGTLVGIYLVYQTVEE